MGYTEEFSGEFNYVKQKSIFKPQSHELFSTWRMMNVRCYDSRHQSYHRYGGRGIKVCIDWRWDNPYGFSNFLRDMEPRPINKTLDRINNNSGYDKNNCKWSTKREQQNNYSRNPKRNSDEVCIETIGDTLKVLVCLNGRGTIVGCFTKNEIELAIDRRDFVVNLKKKHSDDEILEITKSLDKFTPVNKRLRVNKTSEYFGVSWDSSKCKWRATISYQINKDSPLINHHIGRFKSELEAKSAVDDFLIKISENGWYKKGFTDG